MSAGFVRISFCTTAMGRLDHIRQTFLRNIADSDNYPAAEFVLLDYGSLDGLADWVRFEAMELIERGKLVYLRLDGVERFHHAHARNVCFLAASGPVVCNVDADNFIPRGFAWHLNERMSRHPRAMGYFDRAPRGTAGRLAMFRDDFLSVGGYDESLFGWGFEDHDLRDRLRHNGCQARFLDRRFAAAIQHPDARRVEHLGEAEQDRRATDTRNLRISARNIAAGRFTANVGRTWGAARLTRNFTEPLITGVMQCTPAGAGARYRSGVAGGTATIRVPSGAVGATPLPCSEAMRADTCG